jgi:hypothetical protein
MGRTLLLAWALLSLISNSIQGRSSGRPAAEVQVALEQLDDSQIAQYSFFADRSEFPVLREISHPEALLMAVNFEHLSLLPDDMLIVKGLRDSDTVMITSTNQSVAMEAMTSARVWENPLVLAGDKVTVEYHPSLATLLLPPELVRRQGCVAIINSYIYAVSLVEDVGSGSASSTAVVSESIIGNQSELREAVCFKKCAPQMYAKANAVARLLIREYAEDPRRGWDRFGGSARRSTNSWSFCTGWILGRGNYIMTNYHCVADALAKYQSSSSWSSSGLSNGSGGSNVSNSRDEYATADVNLLAETKTCTDHGYKGEKSGVVEATRVAVVAVSKSLDYALLVANRNRSDPDLSTKYGFLTIRTTGPVDGEPIYIPQHPNGEPKEIAATSDGKLAAIHVAGAVEPNWSFGQAVQAVSPDVWYDTDTRPGSSGSPVISQRDNAVVALHHAGGVAPGYGGGGGSDERNYGVRTDLIARDLEDRGVLPLCAIALQCSAGSANSCCSNKPRH